MKTIEQILAILKPYSKEKGIFLANKIEIEDFVLNHKRHIVITFDIQSSFKNNEGNNLKAMLRKNGFENNGVSSYKKVI